MSNSICPAMTVRPRLMVVVALVVGLTSLGGWPAAQPGRAQEQPRLNKIIEALEDGRPAIANQEWRFVDIEHSPFSGELVQSVLATRG